MKSRFFGILGSIIALTITLPILTVLGYTLNYDGVAMFGAVWGGAIGLIIAFAAHSRPVLVGTILGGLSYCLVALPFLIGPDATPLSLGLFYSLAWALAYGFIAGFAYKQMSTRFQ